MKKSVDRRAERFQLRLTGARQGSMKTAFGKQPSGARLERLLACPRYRDGEFRNLHPLLPGLKGGTMPAIGDAA